MVGLSLSFCVADICRGLVAISDVDKIIASTAAKTDDDWRELMDGYSVVYWSEFPARARNVANALRNAGKIEQPRLQGYDAQNIARGHWVE